MSCFEDVHMIPGNGKLTFVSCTVLNEIQKSLSEMRVTSVSRTSIVSGAYEIARYFVPKRYFIMNGSFCLRACSYVLWISNKRKVQNHLWRLWAYVLNLDGVLVVMEMHVWWHWYIFLCGEGVWVQRMQSCCQNMKETYEQINFEHFNTTKPDIKTHCTDVNDKYLA